MKCKSFYRVQFLKIFEFIRLIKSALVIPIPVSTMVRVLFVLSGIILISKCGLKKWFSVQVKYKFISFIISIIFIVILD